jgi:hypothetical protein
MAPTTTPSTSARTTSTPVTPNAPMITSATVVSGAGVSGMIVTMNDSGCESCTATSPQFTAIRLGSRLP